MRNRLTAEAKPFIKDSRAVDVWVSIGMLLILAVALGVFLVKGGVPLLENMLNGQFNTYASATAPAAPGVPAG